MYRQAPIVAVAVDTKWGTGIDDKCRRRSAERPDQIDGSGSGVIERGIRRPSRRTSNHPLEGSRYRRPLSSGKFAATRRAVIKTVPADAQKSPHRY